LEVSAESVGGVRQQRTETEDSRITGRDVGLADDLESIGDVDVCEEISL